jgi:hypothetical protein
LIQHRAAGEAGRENVKPNAWKDVKKDVRKDATRE